MFLLYFLQAGKWIDHSLADGYTYIYHFHIFHYFFSLPDFFWTQFLIGCTSWFSRCCVSTIINYIKGELFYLWKIFGVGAVLVQRWPRCVEASKSKAGAHSRRRKRSTINQGETRQGPRLTLGSQAGERTPKKAIFQLWWSVVWKKCIEGPKLGTYLEPAVHELSKNHPEN